MSAFATTSEIVAFLWVGDIGVAVDTIEAFEPITSPDPARPPSIRISLRSGCDVLARFDNEEARNAAIAEIRKALKQ